MNSKISTIKLLRRRGEWKTINQCFSCLDVTWKIGEIRKLPPELRLLESTRLASRFEENPSYDLILAVAGYGGDGLISYYFDSVADLKNAAIGKPFIARKNGGMSPEKAKIIAYIQAEGCLYIYSYRHFDRRRNKHYKNVRKVVEFYNTCPALIGDFQHTIHSIYEISARYIRKKDKVLVESGRVYDDLAKYGQYGSFKWRIPAEILRGNHLLKTAWIRTFGDSEATVDISKLEIRFTSNNVTGLKQLQVMLNEIGIKSRINGPYSKQYRLIINRQQIKLYDELMGFLHPAKNAKIKQILKEKYQLSHGGPLDIVRQCR